MQPERIEVGLALLSASSAGDLSEVTRLLSLGADPNERDVLSGLTAVHNAAGAGHLAVVRCLVEHGADIEDRRNTVYESPLATAVLVGREDVVAYLLSRGADPEECLYGDDRPLIDEARESGHYRIAELLRGSIKRRSESVSDKL